MYNQNHASPSPSITSAQKGEQIFNEDFVADDEYGLSTLKLLSEDDSKVLTERLHSQGVLGVNGKIHSVAKFYFYRENFNLLVFGDTSGNTGVCPSKHIRTG